MKNWWVNDQGENLLLGIPRDWNYDLTAPENEAHRENPARLDNDSVLHHFSLNAKARQSYLDIRGTLSDAEVERLDKLYNYALSLVNTYDPVNAADTRQRTWNTRIPSVYNQRRR